MVNDLVKRHYKGKKVAVVSTLLETVVRSWVLVRNKLRLTTHSMPSGSWITALFNSLYNRSYTACLYYRETKKIGFTPVVSEYLTIRDYVCGDDKMCGVNSSLKDRINAITMRDFFNSIGMEFTDGRKGVIDSPSLRIDEITFLKRSFRYHTKIKRVMCPLAIETLHNSILWLDNKKDAPVVMDGKLAAFQREMYLHESDYEREVISLESFCRDVNYPFTKLPEEYLLNLFTMDRDEAYILYKRDYGKRFDNF
jgi:hypothetical protein